MRVVLNLIAVLYRLRVKTWRRVLNLIDVSVTLCLLREPHEPFSQFGALQVLLDEVFALAVHHLRLHRRVRRHLGEAEVRVGLGTGTVRVGESFL